MARPSKKDALLDAAGRLVRREGADALTFDALAEEARVSKGGLLYHFGTKEALVRALVERLVQRFEARLLLERAREKKAARGAFTRAYVRASLAIEAGDDDATAAALVTATAIDPTLLEPLRERYRAWARSFARDGLDEVDAMLVRVAVDGLWFAELLGLEPPSARQRAKLVTRLLTLAGGAP